METRLDNGTRVTIRPIRPDDKDLLARAHGRLSADTVYRRFLGPKPVLSGSELRYLTEVDGRDHVALIAVLADEPETAVGVGRFVRLRHDPATADFAIVVGDEYQGQGLGRRLGRMLADAARERGIRRFSATTLTENVAAQRLMATISAGLTRGRATAGVSEVYAEIAA